MNWGRPVALALLALATFGLGWVLVKEKSSGRVATQPLSVPVDQIKKIRLTFGEREIVLESQKPGEWTLPGNWPVRLLEARELARTLSLSDSRFEPQSINSPSQWKDLGLEKPAIIVELTRRDGDSILKISLGQPAPDSGSNRFSLATYARINDDPVAWRLAPGLIDQLSRPLDYYRQRRLFVGTKPPRDPDAGVPRPGDPLRKEQLAAKELILEQTSAEKIRLVRKGEGPFPQWTLLEPFGQDNINPTAGDALLAAVPDIWAERFYSAEEAPAAKTGLDKPEKTVRVVLDNGVTSVLRIGNVSRSRTYKKMRQPPPGAPPGFPGGEETASEDFRFAKLGDNPQVFEVRAAGLNDIFVPTDVLRDPQTNRFVPADAIKVAVELPGQTSFALAKIDNAWVVERPGQPNSPADPTKITDLLTRLAGLEARDKDIQVPATPEKRKAVGLDKPLATLRLTVKEVAPLWPKDAAGNRPSRERIMEIQLGRRNEKDKKIAQTVVGINRLNEVEDSIFAAATRGSMAYRERMISTPAAASVQTIRLYGQGAKEPITLQKEKDLWRITTPTQAVVDESLAGQLESALGSIEAVEWVRDSADKATLEKEFGLGAEALRVEILSLAEMGKPASTTILRIGKARPVVKKEPAAAGLGAPPEAADKPSYFAKIDNRPEIFALAADLQTQVSRPVLAWLPRNPLNLNGEDLVSLRILRAGKPAVLLTKKVPGPIAPELPVVATWKLKEPFETDLAAAKADPLVSGLVGLKVETYEALKTEPSNEMGLGAKATKVVFARKDKPELTLEIGDFKGASRVARVVGQAPVFLLSADLAKAIDSAPLGLLENAALAIDTTRVESVTFTSANISHELARLTGGAQTGVGSGWVVRSNKVEMPADTEAISTILGTLFNLRGGRFVDYGTKADLKAFGLDVPRLKVTVKLKSGDQPLGAPKPTNPTGIEEHSIEIGNPVLDEPGSVHARLDGGLGIMVLGPEIVRALERKPLDLVDRILVRMDPNPVYKIRISRGQETIELVREGEMWKQTKPVAFVADTAVINDWLADVARLRSEQIVAFQPTDAKALGFDPTQGLVELETKGNNEKPLVLKIQIGKDDQNGRLARLEGSGSVGRLSERLTLALSPRPIWFKDRSLAALSGPIAAIDGAKLVRGPRNVTLQRQGPFWKMITPGNSEVDSDALNQMTSQLAKLRVSEWVSDKVTPEKLKEMGLDKSLFQWILTLGNKSVLELQLGTRLADGRVHAKLAGKDPVFLLEATLTERLFGEIRSQRNVFEPAIDALAIDSVRWQSRSGEVVMLVRKDQGWAIAGKDEIKPLTETVNDTLGAFAALRLERFVADKGGDSKLFGLDPAETTIEIGGRFGTRVLKIGTTEEGSLRRYAIADRTPTGEIFVLAHADIERILRSPNQLAKPLPPSAAPNLKLAPLDPVGGN